MNSMSPVGGRSRITSAALASWFQPERSMTPALANGLVFSTLVTRAVTERCSSGYSECGAQQPLNAWYTYWNPSAAFQMSAPAPRTVNVPASHEAEPAAPVSPTSTFPHGVGRLPKPGPVSAKLSNVEVLSVDGSWLVAINPALTHPSLAFISSKFGSVLPTEFH